MGRQRENAEESETLKSMKSVIEMKSASSLELISKHLTLLHSETKLEKYENAGSVSCIIGKVGNKVRIHLKNVVLKPRDEKETCNFQIKVSLLPVQNTDYTFCNKKSTRVYEEKKIVFFDTDDYSNPSSYKFDFDLTEGEEQQSYIGLTQFIELNLYDISTMKEVFSGKVWKYFRGHALFPLDEDVPTFPNDEEFMEYSQTGPLVDGKFAFSESIDTVDDPKQEASASFNQLQLREEILEDDLAKVYIKHRKTQYKNCWKKTAAG